MTMNFDRVLLFPPYALLARPVIFSKMSLSNTDFKIRTSVFLCNRWKKI